MTEDVAFYVELAGEPRAAVVELAVGTGRVAIPIAERTGRRVIGIDVSAEMLELARRHAADAGVALELRQGDMRELALDEPTDLVICPFRAMLHLADHDAARRRDAARRAALVPGGRFAWNAFVFDPAVADEIGGVWRDEDGVRQPLDVRLRRAADRPRARERRERAALVGRSRRVGGGDRRGRARGRGALRLVRPPPVRRRRAASSSTSRVGRHERRRALRPDRAGSTTRGRCPSPRTSSSTSRRRSRSGGPVVELAVGTGRIAVPDREGGDRRDRRRPVAGHARGRAGVRGARGRRRSCLDLRVGDLREPPVAERVPLVTIPFRSMLHMRRRRRPRPGARRRGRDARARVAGSCSTCSRRATRTSRRPTASGWSASPGSSSAPTGIARERTLVLSVRGRERGGDDGAPLALRRRSGTPSSRTRASRSRRCTAGSTGGPARAARIRSGSAGDAEHGLRLPVGTCLAQ